MSRRIIRLPLVMPQSATGIPGYAFAVACTLIKTVSALKPDQFLQLHEAQFASGLMERLIVYSASESLFEEFYSRKSYDLIYSVAASSAIRMPDHVCQTWHGLQGPQGIHPQYDRTESMRTVRLRYEKLIPLTRLSVRRLMQTEGFRRTLEALRREAWKDWHILTGIENVRFNYFLNQNLELRAAIERKDFARIAAVRSEPEREDVLLVPVSEFEIDRLKFGLQSSQVNTLEGLGLRVWQRTPDFGGIDQLLRRFCYWDDDVPHEEIFQLNA